MPNYFVDFAEVKRVVPLPEVLDRLGLLGSLRKEKESWVGQCPLPSHNKAPLPNQREFRVDYKGGTWLFHCFDATCAKGGDVISFVAEYFGYSHAHTRLWFVKEFGDRLTLTKPNGQSAPQRKVKIMEGNNGKDIEKNETADTTNPVAHQGSVPTESHKANSNLSEPIPNIKPLRFFLRLDPNVPYLENRGVTPETIARYEMGLCSKGYFKGWIAAPIHRFPDFETIAYMGIPQVGDNSTTLIRWPRGFNPGNVVFGLQPALEDSLKTDPLYVVDSPWEVLALRQHVGIKSAIAVFGNCISNEQLRLMNAVRRSIVLMLGDTNHAATLRSAGILMQNSFVRIASLPPNKTLPTWSLDQIASRLGTPK